MRALLPTDGIWAYPCVCPECKGLNPEWYDERYHGLPECEDRYREGHWEWCSKASPAAPPPEKT